jgi:hypothetical protein
MPGVLGRRAGAGAGAAIALAALAAVLLPATPGLGSESVDCAYVEAGPPGPEGNVLRIEDPLDSVIQIDRQGDAISVFSNTAGEIACDGGPPTVFNVDRVDLTTNSAPFIDFLAPGASPEPGSPEIEVHVHEGYRPEVLKVNGSARGETMVAGRLGRHKVGINLNAQADGAAQDADFVLDAARPAEVVAKLGGLGGSDTLSALGGAGFSGPFPADHLALAGGPGDDRLIGGPHDDRLVGFTGNDVLLGGRGRDRLTIGPGRDLAKGGKGPDEIFNESDVGGAPPDTEPDRVYGGAGNDRVVVLQFLAGDTVRCGGGRRDVAVIDAGDRTRGCERVE